MPPIPVGDSTKSTSLSADVSSMPTNRNSVIALSPGITSAVKYIMMEWQQQIPPEQVPDASSVEAGSPAVTVATEVVMAGTTGANKEKQLEPLKRHSGGAVPTSADKWDIKESWRKSDSTNSHHTVRANASRTSRPVSWAESFHSAFTIVPPNGAVGVAPGSTKKRHSALIADADFGMPEEEFEDIGLDINIDGTIESHRFISDTALSAKDIDGAGASDNPRPVPNKSSTDSLKRSKRRSISLSSVLPSTTVNFLVGGGLSKPIIAKSQLPPSSTGSTVKPSYADMKISYSISGPENFSTNASHPQSHAHLRQPSENLLIQQSKRPITPVRSADVSYTYPQVPPMSIGPLDSAAQIPTSANPALPLHSTSANLKLKLNAFLPNLPRSEQKLPALPSDTPHSPMTPIATQSPLSQAMSPASTTNTSSHTRQPTLSGIGPSAAGLAKRAVERMGKRWGDMMNGLGSSTQSIHSSSGSGYSSSNSTSTSVVTTVSSRASVLTPPWANGAPSTSGAGSAQAQGQGGFGYGLSRTSSRGSNPASGTQQGRGHAHQHSIMHTFLPGPSKSGGHKRTPNARSLGATGMMGDVASSGASISTLASGSAASTTDSDPFSPSEPVLGRLLRGPSRKGKVVFGKELKTVVRETRIIIEGSKKPSSVRKQEGLVKALEERMLPALVVRCAQHLLIWGVQEEGLFRWGSCLQLPICSRAHLRLSYNILTGYLVVRATSASSAPNLILVLTMT